MKRLLVICLCFFLLSGCGFHESTEGKNSEKLQIVATLFPQYDFAREIAGPSAEVTLLLPPGAESHSFELTPADIIKINEADLFIYTGDDMEAWVPSILESLEGDPFILNISSDIDVHEGHDHPAEHKHGADPHVFTNPKFAVSMAQTLENALCEINPQKREAYRARGAAYRAKLNELDQRFEAIVTSSERKKMIFGGRFAFAYFTEAYGLSWDAAIQSCSSEAEPAATDIARLIDMVKEEKIPVVYYEELESTQIARLICEETGAKPLLFHSCHNISKEELANGAGYLSLMEQNAANLEEGLN